MKKNSNLKRYLLRFCTVGIAATLVYFIVANFLMFINVASAEICSIFAYMAGFSISFSRHRSYTFQVIEKTHGQFLRYCILAVVGLFISYLSVKTAVNVYQISPFWGTLITSASIPWLNFIVMKTWVFNK